MPMLNNNIHKLRPDSQRTVQLPEPSLVILVFKSVVMPLRLTKEKSVISVMTLVKEAVKREDRTIAVFRVPRQRRHTSSTVALR
jgi:hypothetical protein